MSTVDVTWMDTPSMPDAVATSHIIYLDGNEVNRIDAPDNFAQNATILLLDRNYTYSVSATNCNGTTSKVTADELRISSEFANITFTVLDLIYHFSE